MQSLFRALPLCIIACYPPLVKTRTFNSTNAAIWAMLLNYLVNSIAFFAIYIRTFIFEERFPFNTFLPLPISLRFGDLWASLESWRVFGFNGVGFGSSYFPGTYIFVNFLNIFPISWAIWILALLLQTTLIFFVNSILKSGPKIKRVVVIIFLTLCQPFYLIWSTGNLEGIVISLILLAFISYDKRKYFEFSILIGLAASLKLFPIIFILILFFKCKPIKFLKFLFLSILTFLSVTIFSVTVLEGGLLDGNSLISIIRNSNASREIYAELMYFSESSIFYGHSFLNGMHSIFGMSFLETSIWMYPIALLLSLLIFIPSLIVAFTHKFEDWKILLIIGICTLAIIPTSTDYRLAYLYPSVIYILKDKIIRREAVFFLFWIVIIISPKPFFATAVHPLAYLQIYFSAFSFILIPIILIFSSFILPKVSKLNPYSTTARL